MKPTPKFLFLFLLTIFLLTLFPNQITANADNLIEKTCEKTADKDLCISILKSDPTSQEQTDVDGLAYNALEYALNNASAVATIIDKKLNTTVMAPLEPEIDQCYRDCYSYYLDAIDQISDSQGALDEKHYPDVDLWVKSAIAYSQQCDKECTELSGENKMFKRLCNIGLDITKQLH